MSTGPQASGPTVVVVVLNWNGREDTIRCIESLIDGPAGQQIIVVDNGSYDGTLEEIADRWSNVTRLQTGRNLGFTGGMNAGLRWALDRNPAAVAVVNNDVVCPPGTMKRLLRLVGPATAVSPEVRYLAAKNSVWFGAGTVDWKQNWPRHLQPDELCEPEPQADAVRRSGILAGCLILAAADVWRRVGLFDERFFLLFEDSDWSLRARASGIELLVDTSSPIYHRVSASFSGAGRYLGAYYYLRNGMLFGRLWGFDRIAAWRFLRRRVLPQLRPPMQSLNLREVARVLVVMSWALLAHGFRQFGRAPRRLEQLASQWSGASRSMR